MLIFGAGMAGLVAANMLRRYQPAVLEAQDRLPDNHGALLRFRTDAVARAVGQNFKPVQVQKAIVWGDTLFTEADPKMANLYSLKVSGRILNRSIWDLSPVIRYIAPDDFIETMARGVNVCLSSTVDGNLIRGGPGGRLFEVPCISTVPMPVMMDIMEWKDKPDFPYREITSLRVRLPVEVDVYQTLYYPEPDVAPYRASLTGRTLTVELTKESEATVDADDWYPVLDNVLHDFGLRGVVPSGYTYEVKRQRYGKLSPIPEEVRRAFIFWLTQEFNIYSVGRFATWRQLLLDDVVQDVTVVERMMGRDSYARSLHHHK